MEELLNPLPRSSADLIFIALAAFQVARWLVGPDKGPWRLFEKLRAVVGKHSGVFACYHCAGFWAVVGLYVMLAIPPYGNWLVYALATVGFLTLIQQVSERLTTWIG